MEQKATEQGPAHGTAPPAVALRLLLIGIAYLLGHQVSFLFPDARQILMALWPPGGIGLAALLLSPRRLWPKILLVLFVAGNLANALAHRPALASVGFMTANLLESLSCAWLLTRACGDRISFTRTREVLALVVAATLVNGSTAILGAATATLTARASFWGFWETWFIADGLGILLVTPLIVTWSGCPRSRAGIRWGRALEGAAFLCAWCAASYMIFWPHEPRPTFMQPYLAMALLVWGALRLGTRGVSTALVLLVAIIVHNDAALASPFWGPAESATARLLLAQLFVAVTALTGLMLAAAYAELQAARHLVEEEKDRITAISNTLRESRELLRSVIEGTSDAVYVKDTEGRYLVFNKAAARIIGKPADEVLGRDDTCVFPAAEAGEVMAHDQETLATGATVTYEEQVTTCEGHRRIFHATKGPMRDGSGQTTGLFGIARDMTELQQYREQLEGMVREKTAELVAMNASLRKEIADRKQAEEALRAHRLQLAHVSRISMLGELATNLAHEINQPLGAISNYACSGLHLLRNPVPSPEKLVGTLEKIITQVRRAGDVISAIRRFIRREPTCRTVTDINRVVQEAAGLAEYAGAQTDLPIEFAFAQGLPPVRVDVVQIQQVVANLLRNAIEATGAAEVPVAPLQISTARGEEDEVVVAVTNSGPPIDAEVLGKMFEPFFTTKSGGMGMGLSISRTIMEDHNGTIWVTSSPERGTTVAFSLPPADAVDGNTTESGTAAR